MFRKNIYNLIIVIFLTGVVTSCADDLFFENSTADGSDELPIDFSFLMAGEEPASRASFGGAKESFSEEDVIHVSGTFLLSSGKRETRYGALRKSGNNWIPVNDDTGMTWPNTAVNGTFEAYYIYGTTSALNASQPSYTFNLSDIGTKDDKNRTRMEPLYAKSSSEIKYGKAVNMRFTHLLTHLTMEEIYPVVSSQFYFTSNALIKPTATDATGHEFNNAFVFSLDPATNKLSFEFTRVAQNIKDTDYYFITSQTSTGGSASQTTGSVEFFLQPGYYETFDLLYPSIEDEAPYKFLTFKYTPLGGDDENTPPQLNAGYSYVLNIMESPGITIEEKEPAGEDKWDESDAYVIVDVDAFLSAIRDNKEYSETDVNTHENVDIITKNSEGAMVLQRNVDFSNYTEGSYVLGKLKDGRMPQVPQGAVFDGGLHSIINIGCPIFVVNRGTIRNLGLVNFEATDVVLDQNQNIDNINNNRIDNSHKGALCYYNFGLINNLHIENIKIEAKVTTNSEEDVIDAGCIIGANSGTVSNLRLKGEFSITVDNNAEDTDGVNCQMNIGGLVGQNVGGTLTDISALEGDYTVKVVNNCTGTNGSALGAFYIGGAVGYNENFMSAITMPSVEIDASNSVCTKSFIGLLTGETSTSSNSEATIAACNVVGSAVGGSVTLYANLDSGSYMGGLSGGIVLPQGGRGIYLSDCMIVASSLDNSRAGAARIYNATGGCVGRIFDNVISISNISLMLGPITVPNSALQDTYKGTYAGWAVAGQTWPGVTVVVNNSGVQETVGH